LPGRNVHETKQWRLKREPEEEVVREYLLGFQRERRARKKFNCETTMGESEGAGGDLNTRFKRGKKKKEGPE